MGLEKQVGGDTEAPRESANVFEGEFAFAAQNHRTEVAAAAHNA